MKTEEEPVVGTSGKGNSCAREGRGPGGACWAGPAAVRLTDREWTVGARHWGGDGVRVSAREAALEMMVGPAAQPCEALRHTELLA